MLKVKDSNKGARPLLQTMTRKELRDALVAYSFAAQDGVSIPRIIDKYGPSKTTLWRLKLRLEEASPRALVDLKPLYSTRKRGATGPMQAARSLMPTLGEHALGEHAVGEHAVEPAVATEAAGGSEPTPAWVMPPAPMFALTGLTEQQPPLQTLEQPPGVVNGTTNCSRWPCHECPWHCHEGCVLERGPAGARAHHHPPPFGFVSVTPIVRVRSASHHRPKPAPSVKSRTIRRASTARECVGGWRTPLPATIANSADLPVTPTSSAAIITNSADPGDRSTGSYEGLHSRKYFAQS